MNRNIGDFNLPGIDWELFCAPQSIKEQSFINFIHDFGLCQLICEPTRGRNILDLLLVNDPLIISDVALDVPFCTSDHESFVFKIYLHNESVI